MRMLLHGIVVLCLLLAALLYSRRIYSDNPYDWISIWFFTKTLILPREVICVLLISIVLVLMVFLRLGFGIADNDLSIKPTAVRLKIGKYEEPFGDKKNQEPVPKETDEGEGSSLR